MYMDKANTPSPSISQRQSFLSEKANTFSKVDESAWSIVGSRAPSSLHTKHSTCSTDTTEIEYKPFGFEDVLFVSRVYTRNLRNVSYLRLLSERSVALQQAESSDTLNPDLKDQDAELASDVSDNASDADTIITFSRSHAKLDTRPDSPQIASSTSDTLPKGSTKPQSGFQRYDIERSEYWTQYLLLVRSFMSVEILHVKELKKLLAIKDHMQSEPSLSNYVIRDILCNVDSIIDSHAQFMVNLEHINSEPQSVQRWEKLFSRFKGLLNVHAAYVVNQRRFHELASWMESFVFDRGDLELSRILDIPAGLVSQLLKPIQHLSQYSTFLKVRLSCVD